jgi:hypothetical protein
MSNDGPVNTKYKMHQMYINGEKIDPDNLPGNPSDNQLINASKKEKKLVRIPKNPPTFLIAPAQTKEQNKVADKLLEWVKNNEEVVNLSLFGVVFGYNFYELENFVDTNPYFKKIFNLAAQIVSTRLDKRALDQKDAHTLHMRLWQYDPKFKEAWQQKLAAQSKKNDDNKETTIVIHQAPRSDKRDDRNE